MGDPAAAIAPLEGAVAVLRDNAGTACGLRIDCASRGFRRLFGPGAEALEDWLSGQAGLVAAVRRVIESGVAATVEADGRSAHISPFAAGAALLELISQEDERLARLSALHASVLEASQDAILSLDAVRDETGAIVDLRFVQANPAVEQVIGRHPKDLIGRCESEVFPGVLATDLFGRLAAVIETGRATEFEIFYDRDGLRDWYRVSIAPRGRDGITKTLARITEAKAREAGLQAALEAADAARAEAEALSLRLEHATSAARIGIWCAAMGDDRLEWTRSQSALYGVAHGAVQTMADWRALVHPDDLERALASMAASVSGEAQPPVTFRILRGGEVRHIRGDLRVVEDGRGRAVMLGANWDVTDEIETAAQLERRRRDAEAANEAKGLFLANMSHEIRTPMNGVLGMAAALANTELAPSQRRMLTVIQDAGATLMAILEDLLDFSKIEAGQVAIERAPFALADVAASVQALHALRAHEKRLAFTVVCREPASVRRLGDRHRIEQILHNLISNALKFTEQGGVAASIAADPSGDGVTLEVRDTGCGIAPDKQAAIFEHFIQADPSVTRRFGGTGLGLAIVRGLARAMGGDVEVESAPGIGSCFRVRLKAPVAAAAEETAGFETAQPPRRLRILAAEDHPGNQLVLQALLGPIAAELFLAKDGTEAASLYAAHRPELLLFDVAMPGRDGIEALAEIRRFERAHGLAPAPAIAVSANAMQHHLDRYRAAGFIDAVPKPIDPHRLFAAIAQASLQRS